MSNSIRGDSAWVDCVDVVGFTDLSERLGFSCLCCDDMRFLGSHVMSLISRPWHALDSSRSGVCRYDLDTAMRCAMLSSIAYCDNAISTYVDIVMHIAIWSRHLDPL